MAGDPLWLDAETIRALGRETVDAVAKRLTRPWDDGPVVVAGTPEELSDRLSESAPESFVFRTVNVASGADCAPTKPTTRNTRHASVNLLTKVPMPAALPRLLPGRSLCLEWCKYKTTARRATSPRRT